MLTDLESVFRSLKSELGVRPVFHSKEGGSDGHLMITVLAYQCVQVLRKQFMMRWRSIRPREAARNRSADTAMTSKSKAQNTSTR